MSQGRRPRFSPLRAEVLERRRSIGRAVSEQHDGVATRRALRAAGLSDADLRGEVEAGRWHRLGRRTLGITVSEPVGRARLWWAVWESGTGAVLDGVSALLVAGLTHWTPENDEVTVSVPSRNRNHALPGVRRHVPRHLGPTIAAGLPRTTPAVAAIRAAQWSRTDRQAATILAMTVQQRLVRRQDLLDRWAEVHRSRRGPFLRLVIRDICAGAESLGELDFARMCREYGLPEPSRQSTRRGARGRIYLDVYWDHLGLHIEIDGFQHQLGLAAVDDALRQNEMALARDVTLRIPVLGLRTSPAAFMSQVARAVEQAEQAVPGDGAA